jgi:hypothetical protein
MLQWFRARAAAIATVAMLSMAVVGGSAVVPHEDDCHDACPANGGQHDPAAHRIGGTSVDEDSHPLHCLVCHWVRAFRPRTEARVVSAESTETGVNLYVEIVSVSGRAPVAQPPLRSPPASPISA